jgi:hypothetical protein
MGRYATREDQLDRLLRAKRFVDLHMVARQALRAGVERYALKELEAFYDFKRTIDLRTASLHLRAFERALELGRHDEVPHATRDAIEAYNRDDCVSTMRLRDWLEQLRIDSIAAGRVIARPEPESGAPPEALDERQQRVQELYERLAGDVSPDPAERSDEQQARWVLANMLDWHRREKKEEGGLVGVFSSVRDWRTRTCSRRRQRWPGWSSPCGSPPRRGAWSTAIVSRRRSARSARATTCITRASGSARSKRSTSRPASSLWPTSWRYRRPQQASSCWAIPQQLGQPLQGSHPEGTDVSALAVAPGRLRLHLRAFLRGTADLTPVPGPSSS